MTVNKTDNSVSVNFVSDMKLSCASADNMQDGTWWIGRVFVQSTQQRTGLGSKLLQKLIETVLSIDLELKQLR